MILIVDDELPILKTLQMAFDHHGVSTRIASSVEEGWKELKKERPDLLLCDVNMPRNDGFSLVEKIRKDPDLADLRVVFMTGMPTQEHLEESRRLNACAIIRKPFVLKDVLDKVDEALSLSL